MNCRIDQEITESKKKNILKVKLTVKLKPIVKSFHMKQSEFQNLNLLLSHVYVKCMKKVRKKSVLIQEFQRHFQCSVKVSTSYLFTRLRNELSRLSWSNRDEETVSNFVLYPLPWKLLVSEKPCFLIPYMNVELNSWLWACFASLSSNINTKSLFSVLVMTNTFFANRWKLPRRARN